jgi:glyoxylase-like metal-dependent hydrolase (beta-lactamase superfamily II)
MPGVGADPAWRRVGDGLVNFYVVADGAALTLVDAGLPGHWRQLEAALGSIGRSVEDIQAVLVTHGHPDHFGLAERLRETVGADVWVHALDAPILTAPRDLSRWWHPERGLWHYVGYGPRVLRGPLNLVRRGGLRIRAVGEVRTFQGGELLDVPGRPRALHLPGHTRGSAAFVFEARGLLFTGDALVTTDDLTGGVGPRLLCGAFTESSQQALASLDRVSPLAADLLLPGHGKPWHGAPADAVRAAHRAGID